MELQCRNRLMTVRDYLHPARTTPLGSIVFPRETVEAGNTFTTKIETLRALPTFHGRECDDPYDHIRSFENIVRILASNTQYENACLKLFELSLRDGALKWFCMLRPQSLRTWVEVTGSFYKRYFSESKTRHLTRQIQGFQQEREELELMNGVVDGLNAQIRSLSEQKEDCICKFNAIRIEYDDLKSSSEEKAAADAKLLEGRDCDLRQLEIKIDTASTELSRNQVLIADLTQEREDLRKRLDIELNHVENLKSELQITRQNLGKSRDEVSDMQKELQQARSLCFDLELGVSKVKVDFSKAEELFHLKFDEAKCSSEVLAAALKSANDVLKKNKDELQFASLVLATAVENTDILRKELVDVYKKAESTTHEEKKVVASLNRELLELEKQILRDKESRKSLGMDLEEATKSLDEINQNALLHSRELEMTKSQIPSLEDENHAMYTSLVEQKQLSQEARENMEDAHSLIMKLGMEKENFGNRVKKLEEELALAKGEILRLRSLTSSSRALVNDWHHDRDEGSSKFPSRSQTNSSRDPVNDRNHQRDEGGNNAPFSGKKFSSRRKGNPQRDKF